MPLNQCALIPHIEVLHSSHPSFTGYPQSIWKLGTEVTFVYHLLILEKMPSYGREILKLKREAVCVRLAREKLPVAKDHHTLDQDRPKLQAMFLTL